MGCGGQARPSLLPEPPGVPFRNATAPRASPSENGTGALSCDNECSHRQVDEDKSHRIDRPQGPSQATSRCVSRRVTCRTASNWPPCTPRCGITRNRVMTQTSPPRHAGSQYQPPTARRNPCDHSHMRSLSAARQTVRCAHNSTTARSVQVRTGPPSTPSCPTRLPSAGLCSGSPALGLKSFTYCASHRQLHRDYNSDIRRLALARLHLPTLQEAMDQALSPQEADGFIAHLRPLVESGTGVRRTALAYLTAAKS